MLRIFLYIIATCSFVISVFAIKQFSRLIKKHENIPKDAEADLVNNGKQSLRYATIACISTGILGLTLYLSDRI